MDLSQQLSLFASSEGESDLNGELGVHPSYEINNAQQQQQDREENTPIDHDDNDGMQQQLAVHQQTDNQGSQPPAIPHESSATNQAGLGQLNTMLVNMLQQSAQSQPGQNPMQNAVLAQILAAANGANFHNSSQYAPGAVTNLPSGQQGQQHQAGAFVDQPAGSQIPVNVGVQSLQQQLMMIQQQLGGGFAPPQQNVPQYQPMQPPQHQQGQFGSQQLQQFAPAQYQQQFPFMSHMGQGFNPALFHNYGAFGPFGQFGGSNNAEQTVFMNQVQMPNNGMQGFDGLGTAYQGAFPMQQQPVSQSETPPNDKKMEKPKGAAAFGKSKSGHEGPEHLDRGKKIDPTKRSAQTFPEKLMQAMMMVADDDVVAWLPDGKSFVVVDPERICAEVLAKVFKESKYPSFVRKLHRWGFVRLTSGTGTDCFYHPQFIKGKRDLASRITCAVRGEKEKDLRAHSKPPSLAGVEKFIHAKVMAAANAAAKSAGERSLVEGRRRHMDGTTRRDEGLV